MEEQEKRLIDIIFCKLKKWIINNSSTEIFNYKEFLFTLNSDNTYNKIFKNTLGEIPVIINGPAGTKLITSSGIFTLGKTYINSLGQPNIVYTATVNTIVFTSPQSNNNLNTLRIYN